MGWDDMGLERDDGKDVGDEDIASRDVNMPFVVSSFSPFCEMPRLSVVCRGTL
jgi:hypothetical protein